MTPAIGFILAGLFASAPIAHDASRSTATTTADVTYECPQTYKLANTSAGKVICLRARRDLAR